MSSSEPIDAPAAAAPAQQQPGPPPPIPERPGAYSASSPFMAGSSLYGGGFGGGAWGGGAAYGGYGTGGLYGAGPAMYGSPWGQPMANSPMGFVRAAEERTQPAFDTILSVVQGFNSVSAMLESTYLALHSCFRALVGVVESLSRVRGQFSNVLSAFAAVRFVRALYARVRQALGYPPSMGEAWQDERAAEKSAAASGQPQSVNWPLLVYSGLVVAAPYFMWRLAAGGGDAAEGSSQDSWVPGEEEDLVAVAEYAFSPADDTELRLLQGQRVLVAPRHRQPRVRGWILCAEEKAGGHSLATRTGLVPANYVRIVGRKPPSKRKDEKEAKAEEETGKLQPDLLADADLMESAFK